jgi:hypothetical protein
MSDVYDDVRDEAETALVELARDLVGDLASGRLMALALAAQEERSPGRDLANVRWQRGKGSVIGGRTVQRVLAHPQSPTILYDLGGGHFAEGEKGKAPGTVLHSPQFSAQALAEKGWAEQVPAGGEPATGGASGPAGRPGGQRASEQARESGEVSGPQGQTPARKPGTGSSPAGSPRSGAVPASGIPEALAREMARGGATDEQGTLDGHGQVWHPDRAAIHNEIVRQHLDDAIPVPSQGRAVLTGGLGQHRTDLLSRAGAIPDGRYAHVCLHQITSELAQHGLVPEVKGLTPEQSGVLVHHEAAHVASLISSALAARRKNQAICGSMTDPDAVGERVRRLRSSGYGEVRGIHLSTPVDKAADNGARAGIPPMAYWDLAGSHGADDSARGFEKSKQHFDGWEHWDHSGAVPVRKARGGRPATSGPASIEDLAAGHG